MEEDAEDGTDDDIKKTFTAVKSWRYDTCC